MADRTVKVTLAADVRGFAAGMAQAQTATKQLGSDFRQESQAIGQGLSAIGIAAGAGVGIAVAKFGEFDQSMSYVQAATHETAANMDLLRDAAMDAGAKTVFSATESANAIEELAKAGISTSDILGGGLAGALDLAAAGGLGVADAAGIAATALTQFKLSGKDVPHVADLLAAGAGKAMGSVEDLSAALNQGGLVANSTGLTIEETTGTLSAFASAGLLGSDAGTSFKTMLQRLTPQSAEAREKMKELGISAYDAQGQFIGMSEFAGVLQTALKDLTPEARQSAMSVMFGADAVRAATVLYDEGAKGIAGWVKAVDDQGYAAETAALRLDNLAGDVEQLGGAMDTAFIKTGAPANEVLRGMVQIVTDVVNVFSSAPAPVQQTALILGTLTAAVGLAGGAFFLAVPKVVEFQTALSVLAASKIPGVSAAIGGLSTIAGTAGRALAGTAAFLTTPWGLATVAAAASTMVLVNVLDMLKATSSEVQNALVTATTAAEIFNTVGQGREWSAFRDVSGDLGNMSDMLDRVAEQDANIFLRFSTETIGFRKALGDVGKELGTLAQSDLPSAQRAFSLLADTTDGSKEQFAKLLEQMPEYRDALVSLAKQQGINVTTDDEAKNTQRLLKLAMGEGSAAAEEQAAVLRQLEGKSEDTGDAVEGLADQIRGFADAVLNARSAQRDLEEAFDSAHETLQAQKDAYAEANGTLDGFSASLDIGTQAGRENQAALDAIAGAAKEAAASIYEQTGSQEQATAAVADGRAKLIDMLAQFGITGEAADAYADNLGLIPGDISTFVGLTGISDAERELQQFILKPRTISIKVNATNPNVGFGLGDGHAYGGTVGMAGGGTAWGPGTSKSDSIPVWLSRGEEVIQEPYASRHRAHLKAINGGWTPNAYASGGTIGTAAPHTTGYSSASRSTAAAEVSVMFNSPVMTPNGTLVGMIRGIAGEEVRLELADQESSLSAGYGGRS